MKMPPPEILGIIIGVSEFVLTLFTRSKKSAVSKDRHSLEIIWVVNLAAIALGVFAAYRLYWCRLPWPQTFLDAGYGLFVLGLALRWYSIIYLGRFFTTNVAIASDHRIIDTGPYRCIRHPSYTGALLAILGLCLSFPKLEPPPLSFSFLVSPPITGAFVLRKRHYAKPWANPTRRTCNEPNASYR